MDNLFSKLLDVMQQELVAYKDILNKAKQTKDVLLKNDVAMLDRIVAHEGNVVKTIKQLETQREQIIRIIARDNGISFANVKLGDIAELNENAERSSFLKLKEELSKMLSEIEDLNRVNKALVETHLQYSAFCVNLLTGSTNTIGNYSLSGQISEPQERATLILDRMV